MTVRDGFDAAIASILGICGLLLILAAIGYLLIMLVRAGALVLIIATSPIAAAGLVAEGTRAWFWKALRWFLAALMMAPLSALIFGIGIKLTEGVISGAVTGYPAAVGQAVIGTVLVIIGAFAPLVLFRLLAFVDPGTSSGQAFRASLDAAGGVAGLLGGRGQGGRASESTAAAAPPPRPAATGPALRVRPTRPPQPKGGSPPRWGRSGSTMRRSVHGRAEPPPRSAPTSSAPPASATPSPTSPPHPTTQTQDSPAKPQDQPRTGQQDPRATGWTGSKARTRHPAAKLAATPTRLRHRVTRRRHCRHHRRCRAEPGTAGPGGAAADQPRAGAAGGRPWRQVRRWRRVGGAVSRGRAPRSREPAPPRCDRRYGPTLQPVRPAVVNRAVQTVTSRSCPNRASVQSRSGVATMSAEYADYTKDRVGFFFGMTGPQLATVMMAGVPLLLAVGVQRWAFAGLCLLGFAAVVLLVVVPVRGRSATQWIGALVAHTVGRGLGWSAFRGKVGGGGAGRAG